MKNPPNDNAELLPCPFCGGEDLSLDNLGDDTSWGVECESCHTGQHSVFYRQRAILSWNTRTVRTQQNPSAGVDEAFNQIHGKLGHTPTVYPDTLAYDYFNAGFKAALATKGDNNGQ